MGTTVVPIVMTLAMHPKTKKAGGSMHLRIAAMETCEPMSTWKMDAVEAVETKRMVIIKLYNAKQ